MTREEISNDNKKDSGLLSNKLRQRRRLLNITLEELSAKTGIQTKYLRRIEEGNWSDLPTAVYTRGFLKQYARIVGLNTDEVIARYNEEREKVFGKNLVSDKVSDSRFGKFLASFFRFGGDISPKMIRTTLILIVLLLILGYISWQFSIVFVRPQLNIENPQEDEVVLDEDNIVFKGKIDSEANLFLNDRLMEVDSNGFFEKQVELLPGLNVLEFKAVSRFGKETVVVRRVIYTP